jgi:SAM-dependent methyltransferase
MSISAAYSGPARDGSEITWPRAPGCVISFAMSAPRLFDRALIARRLDRALAATPADFLLRRAVDDLEDRLALIKRGFADALDLGTPGPHAAAALTVERVTRIAPTAASLGVGRFAGRVGEPGGTPIGEAAFDLAVSLFAMHEVDDLPGALIQLRRALKPDGLLLAALPGGDTLSELRESLLVAESEMTGGASPRVIPFADARALGGLLQRAGFALPVVDSDRFTVRYSDMFALMRDLRAFGATNPLIDRSRRFARRELFLRAARVYAERFADADGRVRATFEILWLSAWAPHPSQQKPLAPGSARMRLEDAVKQKRP